MNETKPLTNITVLFSKIDKNKTKVTVLHTGWRPGGEREAARQYFINAWTGACKKLEGLVNESKSF